MPDLVKEYFAALRALIDKIQDTQAEAIDRAATAIVESAAQGGAWHIYDTGHMISSEAIGRAGGLFLARPLRYALTVDNPTRQRPPRGPGGEASLEGLAAYVLRASNVRRGDVLLIGSVSGKTVPPVDLAIEAKRAGVTVIAMTSLAYSSGLASEHSSGKRLFEAADIVLDNGAPPEDAMLAVPGLGPKICPASGIGAATIIWALTAAVVQKMMARGLTPQIYKSINKPGNREENEVAEATYSKVGY